MGDQLIRGWTFFVLLFVIFLGDLDNARAELRLVEWRLSPEHAWMVLPARDSETDLQAVLRYVGKVQAYSDLGSLMNGGKVFSGVGEVRPFYRTLLLPNILIAANSAADMSSHPTRLNNNANLYRKHGVQTAHLPIAAQVGLTAREAREFFELIIGQFEAVQVLGGGDIDPVLYNGLADPNRRHFLSRDQLSNEFLRYVIYEGALKGRILLFGICRGFQEIGVAMGYSLDQEVELDLENRRHTGADHPIDLNPQAFLASIFGIRPLVVNSIHHQAVLIPAGASRGLFIAASAEGGRVVEAAQSRNGMILGFQFHPELMALANEPVGINIFSFLRRKIWSHFVGRHLPKPCWSLLGSSQLLPAEI